MRRTDESKSVRKRYRFGTTTLAGHSIGLYWVDGLSREKSREAQWLAGERRIELDIGLSRTSAQECLVHEAAHAVSDEYDLGLSEQQVRILGLGLQQMLSQFLRVVR